jgi:hypothetical protein
MPIVRPYPIGEASPQPLHDAQPGVPAAGDTALFGGNQAGDLQVAGQQLGQTSDSLFALYERKATEANDNRVQDFNNQFLNGRREILSTGPDAYYKQTGADAIHSADGTAKKLTALKDQLLGQTGNDYQRQKLGPILDAHLAASADGIARYVDEQQRVYARTVAANAIQTSRAEAVTNPANLTNAVMRAEDAARVVHAGQPPEVVETGVRAAGGSVIAGVIGDRLARNDPAGVTLFRQYGARLDPSTRRTLGAAAEMLSNSVAAAAWVRDRSAALRTPALTGDAVLDAVNTASASTAEAPPVISSGGVLLDQDGIAGTRQRLDEIEDRRRALTALNEREFAGNPARQRANRTVIETDSAQGRAAVKAEADKAYADLRAYMTTGGSNGGPAVTPPPSTLMSRFTDGQQASIVRQVDGNIGGRLPATDPQTWNTIRQGLTGDDATERQRWADANLVQFMGRLSNEDFAALQKLQAAVRSNDGGAETTRLQIINRMANQALRSADIDPTPRPDAAPDSDAAQAARFQRALQDELSTFESRGRKATAADAYDIVNSLKDTAIKGGWLKASDQNDFLIKLSDVPPADDSFNKNGVFLAQAKPQDDKPGGVGAGTASPIKSDPGSPVYRDAQQVPESSGRSGSAPPTEPPSNDPEFIKALKAWPGMPVILPNGDHIEDPKSPTGYVMAPFPGLESVVKAARRARSEIQSVNTMSPTATPLVVAAMMYDALHRNVDHGGDFDYQRLTNKDQKGGFVQLPKFRNISNVNVGLFCQQVGLPRETALVISGIFAAAFSSNRDLGASYFLDKDTKKYIDIGYDLGERGTFN